MLQKWQTIVVPRCAQRKAQPRERCERRTPTGLLGGRPSNWTYHLFLASHLLIIAFEYQSLFQPLSPYKAAGQLYCTYDSETVPAGVRHTRS